MTWAATGIGVASMVGGGVMASSASRRQRAGMQAALDYQMARDREIQARFEPYQELGRENINAFRTWANPENNPNSYRDPGYQFRFDEGMKGLYSNAATSGMLQSGDTIRAATAYGQDMSSQEYNNAFNRWLGEGQFRGNMAIAGQNAAATEGALLNQGAANYGNISANTDFGGSDRAWGDVIVGAGGMVGNSLARYMGGRRPAVPGGSNIFSPTGPSVQPRNLDGTPIG